MDKKWWMLKMLEVNGSVAFDLPADAVILGIDHSCEDDDQPYLEYLIPASETEIKTAESIK